jgi:hypothetical protein
MFGASQIIATDISGTAPRLLGAHRRQRQTWRTDLGLEGNSSLMSGQPPSWRRSLEACRRLRAMECCFCEA